MHEPAPARNFEAAYVGATKEFGDGQAALRAALSAYNTGDFCCWLRTTATSRAATTARAQRSPEHHHR